MNSNLQKILIKALEDTLGKVKTNSCEMDDNQTTDLIKQLAHIPMSKDQACSYLNMSRAKFDQLVSEGKLPKGRKCRGFKELRWYQDELTQ